MTNTIEAVEVYTIHRPNVEACTAYSLPDGSLEIRDDEGNLVTLVTWEEIAATAGPTIKYRHAIALTDRLGRDAFIVDPYAAWPVEDRPHVHTGFECGAL